MKRRDWLQKLNRLGILALTPGLLSLEDAILTRTIPSTREPLPAVGLGTWRTFDINNSLESLDPLKKVLQHLHAKGGKVLDSSPMYGRSESVAGQVSFETKLNDNLFIATKVWTSGKENGIRQMHESLKLLQRDKIDLMQIHNLVDWQTHIKTLRAWKEEGKIRYIGITHYLDSMHDTMIEILGKEKIDFIQVNYNLSDRHADERLLPFAQDKGVAVIINRPFQEGALFNSINQKSLPLWADEFNCHNWAQFFLKFILSHPAVTCAIPATSQPTHMLENIGAAYGKLPTQKQRQQMIRYFNN